MCRLSFQSMCGEWRVIVTATKKRWRRFQVHKLEKTLRMKALSRHHQILVQELDDDCAFRPSPLDPCWFRHRNNNRRCTLHPHRRPYRLVWPCRCSKPCLGLLFRPCIVVIIPWNNNSNSWRTKIHRLNFCHVYCSCLDLLLFFVFFYFKRKERPDAFIAFYDICVQLHRLAIFDQNNLYAYTSATDCPVRLVASIHASPS